jgi:hypothetical protein
MVFVKVAEDELVGRFDPQRVAFMPLRPDLTNPLAAGRTLGVAALSMPHYGTTTLDPGTLLDPAEDFALFLHLHIAGLTIGTSGNPHIGKAVTVSDADSIAEAILAPVAPASWTVLQRGPRRLWDTVEHATRLWDTLEHPDRSRYGITAAGYDADDTKQYVWLDEPDGPYSWPMPL